jgi:hypothetical protein
MAIQSVLAFIAPPVFPLLFQQPFKELIRVTRLWFRRSQRLGHRLLEQLEPPDKIIVH